MIDLNELKQALYNGQLDKNNVRVVMRNGEVVDFLTKTENPTNRETIKTMPLLDVLKEVFEI